eukprot:2792992-Amphidinium_carterae.1
MSAVLSLPPKMTVTGCFGMGCTPSLVTLKTWLSHRICKCRKPIAHHQTLLNTTALVVLSRAAIERTLSAQAQPCMDCELMNTVR